MIRDPTDIARTNVQELEPLEVAFGQP